MTDLLKQVYDPGLFRDQAHRLVDLLADHLESCLAQQEDQVLPWVSPNEKLDFWKRYLMEEIGSDKFWPASLHETIHIHHPRYMGHQVCPSFPLSGLGELVNGTLNNGSAIYEMGPVSTAMERVVTDWLAQAIGLGPDSTGVLTSGGSLGNLTALLAARQHQSGYNHWTEGQRDTFHPALMVSEEAHYSIGRAAQIMGWGQQGIVKVPTDNQHRMDTGQLERCYIQARERGLTVIALSGNACSTSTGIYDRLDILADFCHRHGLWFHVDGAHGGPAALTPKYHYLTDGIEQADSVVIDFHKMMGVSALTTAVLFRNKECSYETFDQQAVYLLNDRSGEPWYNSAIRTVECTKNMMGMKVYAILKTYGAQVFVDYITVCYDLARTFAGIISSYEDFELPYEPESNILCFRYKPADSDDQALDDLNSAIRRQIVESGAFYIVQTRIGNQVYLRTTLMNPFTSEKEMRDLLELIRKTGRACLV